MPRFTGTLVQDQPVAEPMPAPVGVRPRFSGTLVPDVPDDAHLSTLSPGGRAAVEKARSDAETSNGYKMMRAGYLGALDGGSLSFGDELGAGLGAASEYLGGFITGEKPRSYDELLTAMREQDKQAKAEAPGSYMLGQIAGGVATTAPIAGGSIVATAGRALPERLALSGGAGAVTGAAQGFGAGEGGFQNRLHDAAIGGGIGLGLGAAALPVGAAVGKGLNTAADIIAARGAPVSRGAQNVLRETLANEGLTVEEAGRLAQQMGPTAMLADATEGLRYRTEQLAQADTPARSGVINSLRDRSATAGERITGAYDDVLGQRPNVQQTLSTMAKEAKGRADPLHTQARTENLPVDVNPVIEAVDGQLMTPAERIAGRPDLPSDDVDNALSWVRSHLTDGQSQRTGIDHLDRLERRVRAKTKAAFESGRSDVGHALNEVGKVLRGQLKASSPVYAEARQTFADDMSVKEAFETGQKLFGKKVHPDFLSAEIADMSDSERQALKLGVRAAVDEAMGSVRNGSLKGRQLLDADWNERKLIDVLGEDDGRKLINSLTAEQAMADTANQVLGGPATARRLDNPFRSDAPAIPRAPQSIVHGITTLAQKGVDAVTAAGKDRLARELGPILTATGKTRDQRIMELLEAGVNRDAVKANAQKQKAIAQALLQTGGLAAAPQMRR